MQMHLGEDWYNLIDFNCAESIYLLLKKIEEDEDSISVFPSKEKAFLAYRTTPPKDVRTIILSKCPYPNMNSNGFAFSCSYLSTPSLRQLYFAWTKDKQVIIDDKTFNYPLSLDYLTEQGVLLLNVKLRVKKNDPDSYNEKAWQTFNDCLLNSFARNYPDIPILFLGNAAKKCMKSVEGISECSIYESHPVAASKSAKLWDTDVFDDINIHLVSKGYDPIQWKPNSN
jgi:uracil-DNA glycosylase